ncbi:hypothetical protein, partial [Bilophila wadsworthia]|uniref:hypothetical protein n=1 Tax=Bilophila wadsworthia TaxID=35833 RepID=UPI003AB4EACA
MAKRVMLFCVCCLLVSLILRTEALAGFGNVEWGASPQDIQQKLGIKELNKSPLLTKDKYFIWGEEWGIGAFTDETGFCSVILVRMDDSRDGDDTVLLVLRDNAAAAEFADEIKEM